MKKIFILLVFCCLFFKINAQEFEGIAKGDKEVSFNGMVIATQGMTMGNIFLSYGYYFTKKLEVGLAPGVTITSDNTDVSGQLFVNYNFSNNKPTFPYVKASYYQQTFDTGESGFFSAGFIEAGLGLKSFFNSKVSWDTSIVYGFPASSGGSSGSGMLMLLTGISIKW